MKETMERRSFLKELTVAGGALAAVGLTGCASGLADTGNGANAESEGGAMPAIDEKLFEKLQTMLAKEEIREKINNYSRSMDRIDRELGYSLFSEDSYMDYGDWYTGSGPGFIDVVCDFHTAYATAHQHHMTNITIEVNGDEAASETYVDMVMRLPGEDGTVVAQNVHGRYFDKWVLENGEWLMKFRTFVRDLGEEAPIAPEADMGSTGGSREKNDYSYTLFAQA